MSSIVEAIIDVPAEHASNVFGQFDDHMKKIERTLNVTLISRDGVLKILGSPAETKKAKSIVEQLILLAKRGNTITMQNVNYALALAEEEKEEAIAEIDRDCICHTINGRPIKPKTLGQKQ